MPNQEKPRGFFNGFQLFDWFAIFVCADFLSSGLFSITTGGIWLALFGVCMWYMYEWHVRAEIRRGLR